MNSSQVSQVSKVIVGVDGSKASKAAIQWATGFAHATSTEVEALHTWMVPLTTSISIADGSGPTTQFLQAQATTELEKAWTDADVDAATTNSIVEGRPGPVLAERTAPDTLVAVGRTGRGRRHGLARAAEVILGSAARHCLHHAAGPVVTVPADTGWTEAPKIVVGIDGSASSLAALAWCLDAMPADAKIMAVQCVRPWIADPLAPFDNTYADAVVGAAKVELQGMVDPIIAAHASAPTVEVSAVDSDARSHLTSSDLGADIVIVAATGRSGIAAAVLGSVADHVVRNARCPVVVVPGVTN